LLVTVSDKSSLNNLLRTVSDKSCCDPELDDKSIVDDPASDGGYGSVDGPAPDELYGLFEGLGSNGAYTSGLFDDP
jgi:hypothetical protein